jgi:CubicO group peptidase (beta-lactamase class C family)
LDLKAALENPCLLIRVNSFAHFHSQGTSVKKMALALFLVVVLSACAPTITPTPTATPVPPTTIPTQDPKALAAELDALMQKNYQAGVFDGSILVARNGQVILSQGYGFADQNKNIPNMPQTKYRLGSLSRQFAAAGILLLQVQGKLSMQDKLCDYVPDCPGDLEADYASPGLLNVCRVARQCELAAVSGQKPCDGKNPAAHLSAR